MLVKLYLHSSKDSNLEAGTQLGLEGKALEYFCYLGYEEKLTYEVNRKTGEGTLTGVNGFKISEEKL